MARPSPTPRRALAPLLLALLVACLVLPASAAAHATLEGTSPSAGDRLDRAPSRVVFRFSEHVEGSFGALRVVDDAGRRVDDGKIVRPAGHPEQIGVGLRPGTGDGAYAATYRVVSADGHPVEGGATFVVGASTTARPRDVRAVLDAEKAPAAVPTALSIARAVSYVGIAGAVGLLVLLLAVWRPLRRRGAVPDPAQDAFAGATARLARIALGIGFVGAVCAYVLQGASAGGTGVLDALRPSTLWDLAGTATGRWLGLSVLGLAALLVALPRALRAEAHAPGGTADDRAPAPDAAGRRPRPALVVSLLAAVVLVLQPALGGHAAASSPSGVLVPVQVVHVAAMGSWLGGLLVLLLALPRATRALPDGVARTRLLAGVLWRFGPVALVSVSTLTLAGTLIAILQLTSLYDLTDTAYGRAILIKAFLVLGAIAVAVAQREVLVPRLRRIVDGLPPTSTGPKQTGPRTPEREREAAARDAALPRVDEADRTPGATGLLVRRALRGEVALLLVVLVVTGALAGYAPPGTSEGGPQTVSRDVGGIRVQADVDPARPGTNAIHLYAFGRDGAPLRGVRELTLRATRDGAPGPGIDVSARPSGPGHWLASAVPLAPRGTWRLRVALRTSAFDETEATLPVRVR